ncbi:hypothetical protein FM037_10715 [Shewanella psychropiezotolerans]|uniref:Lipoprotein n=1 Tax=Shewanella psychropiezotolerans TaxID=2593655 RepID=A0ABX5WX18_9GAMM|nr:MULTISPECIES: hypothetical protein [Shewanella]MPY26008.1 hypothetical protein [Shewanella sp. YLB-07]QDO83618.1 hypothetical protein FM037_10715 [Shewanella psychropiezotolerans]
MKIIALLSLLFLAGCSPDSAPTRTPEQVSLGFFHAIYVERDVNKAKQFVNEPMKEVLSHYYIASAVQRHVLNLSMTEVTMQIEEIDIDFFRKFTDDVTVIVKMQGLKGGEAWIDDRTIRLHKIGSRWEITEVLLEKGNLN